MAEINLPLSITYQTEGTISLPEIIAALHATDALSKDAISLFPSLIPGLVIERSSVNVRLLSQESPLREIFVFSLLVAFQDDLRSEVPPILEELFKIEISDKYDTLATVVFMLILFYGANFAKDATVRLLADSKIRARYQELLNDLATTTEKTPSEVEAILESRFAKPNAMQRLVSSAKGFFIPSHRSHNAPVTIDRQQIDSDTVREVPFADISKHPDPFQKFEPYRNVALELHAKDKDKKATGWAAIAKGVCDKRLRMKVMEHVSQDQLWGKDYIVGDIVLVSKLGANGFTPVEIHLLSVSP